MPESLLRVLACGSVDDGKSTLIGRLLFECGTIPDDVMAALVRDSIRFGTVPGGTDYALLVDGLAAERDQGITIDVAYRFFETPRRRFILADAPGHEQYTRNMVTGASASDVAVLLVDARKGLLVQTRRHAAIASLLGIRQVVLAVNKMDLVGFEQAVFDKIVTDFYALLGKLGPLAVTAIPVCARDGDNVTVPSTRMPWYSGTTLLTALEGAEPTSHVSERAFRMPVQLVARPDHTFRGYAGTVATGIVRPGEVVVNAMSGTEAKVSRIVTMDGDRAEAVPGDAVTLVLDREIDVSRGDVLAAAPPPALADQVTAWVVWMDETPLFRGRAYLVMLGSRAVIGTITEITNRLDVDTLAEVPVRELGLNEIGRVTISLAQRLPCERYAVSRDLGGFILIDRLTRNTVGAGMVTDLRAGAANIQWHRLDVDKRGARRADAAEVRRAVVHRAVGVGEVHDRQPGGEGAACAGPSHDEPGRRQRAARAEPRPWVLGSRPGGEHPPRGRGLEAVRRGGADRARVVHLALSGGADAGAGLRRGRRVPGDLRRYAGRGMPAARSQRAVPTRRRRTDPQLHRRGCAVRGAAGSGTAPDDDERAAGGAGGAGGARAARSGNHWIAARLANLPPKSAPAGSAPSTCRSVHARCSARPPPRAC